MSDYLICCFQSGRDSTLNATNKKFAIRSIDKSMIGLPTNFQHCAHIGCSDVLTTSMPSPNTNLNNAGFIDIHNYRFNSATNGKTNSNGMGVSQPFVSHMKLIDLKTS